MKLLKDVISEIKPKKTSVMAEVKAFLDKVNSQLKKDKVKATAIMGGSVAKDTFLAGDFDCDIYAQFDYSYKDKDISILLGKSLKKLFPKLKKLHGSRDYYQVQNNLNFEIVPVLKIKNHEEAMNITDCSFFHVTWVKKFPKIKDEIRLAKAFCKANNIYGAESYIKGFSGHVVDILTIHYGGFLKLLKASEKWKLHQVIDHYNEHKGKAMFNLNKSKRQSALIVIDPVDPYRNASAALGKEKFDTFKKRAKEFLKRPGMKFFVKETFSIDKIKKKYNGKKIITLDVTVKTGKQDVIGAKLLKSHEFILKQLKRHEFDIIAEGWSWDKKNKAVFYLVAPQPQLSAIIIRTGPPTSKKQFAEVFKKKYKNTYTKSGVLYAKDKREYRLPEELIKKALLDDYLKEKIKEVILMVVS